MLSAIDKVDLQVAEPSGRRVLVAVAEAGDWQHENALWQLQEKFNHYGAYALDGQMHRQFPESIGKPVTFVLSSVDPIPDSALALVERMRPILGAEGVELETKRTEKQAA